VKIFLGFVLILLTACSSVSPDRDSPPREKVTDFEIKQAEARIATSKALNQKLDAMNVELEGLLKTLKEIEAQPLKGK